MRPTVVTGLSDSTRCMQEEIFGQCISVIFFSNVSKKNDQSNYICLITTVPKIMQCTNQNLAQKYGTGAKGGKHNL